MIIDSSAIIALLKAEKPEAPLIAKASTDAPWGSCYIGAPTLLEIYIVVDGRFDSPQAKAAALENLSNILLQNNIQIVSFTANDAAVAFIAYQHFHKPPARLNFGDCFSYALAIARNEPLLCKGDDFKMTDLKLVEY